MSVMPINLIPCLPHAPMVSGVAPVLIPTKPASLAALTLRSIDHSLSAEGWLVRVHWAAQSFSLGLGAGDFFFIFDY